MKTAKPKTASKSPAPPPPAAPKKAAAKPAAKPAPKKAPARKAAASGKKATSREMMLARVESVRLSQRSEGHFDCFARAVDGYCDQGGCAYHVECLSVSRLVAGV